MDEKISVVVPVYKVETLLSRCVHSLIDQDYSNIEIILVDDGSPDACPEICDDFARTDNRIHVIHKKNGGLSDARNAGVQACTSNYVMFVDSDDYVDRNYVSSLWSLKSRFGADIACTPIIYEFEGGYAKRITNFEDQVIDKTEAQSMVMRGRHGIGVTVCGKLFPVDTIRKHPFPLGRLHEDLMNALDLYEEFNKIAIGANATYHYIQRISSIMHSSINYASLTFTLNFLAEKLSKIRNQRLRFAIVKRIVLLPDEYCWAMELEKDKVMIEKIQMMTRPYIKEFLRDPENSGKTKIKGLMLTNSKISLLFYRRLKVIRFKGYGLKKEM